jgi:O-antigen/teichoic acid export membrane protein
MLALSARGRERFALAEAPISGNLRGMRNRNDGVQSGNPGRRVWAGYLSVTGAKFAGLGLGIALSVAAARILAPAGRGDFATVAAFAVIGVQVLNLGLSSGLAVRFAEEPGRVLGIIPALWKIAIGWACLLGAAGFVATAFLGSRQPFLATWWPAWSLWIPLQLLGLYQGAALRALENFRSISVLEIGGRGSAVLLGLAALWLLPGRVGPFVSALVVSDFFVALAGAAFLFRAARAPRPPAASANGFMPSAFRLGVRAYPVLLLPYLLIKSDLLILHYFRGSAETGVYSVASQIIDIGLILPATVAGLALPAIVRDPALVVGRLFRQLLWVLLGCAGLAALFAGPAIRLLFGAPYAGAYVPLLLLLPGFVALALETLLAQYFAAAGFPAFLSRYWLYGVLLNVGLNLILVPRFGLVAAAATSSLGYMVVFLLVLGRFRRDATLPWRSLVLGFRTRRVS